MADLLRNNKCNGCKFYDFEANDYYYQWCQHPDVDKYTTDGFGGDINNWVKYCPLTGKPPYPDSVVKEYYR